MIFVKHSAVLLFFLLLTISSAFGQSKTVAITIVSAAPGGVTPADLPQAIAVNERLLAAFQRHHVPVTGFVIEKRVENLGTDAGRAILRKWVAAGFDLGNHFYSHADTNNLTIEQIKQEIIGGEPSITLVLGEAGRKPQFLRFPFNHTGDTKEKHDAIAAYIASRGYRLAPCTIDNSDWVFNAKYAGLLGKHDDALAAKLRSEYLAYTAAEIDWYAALNRQVLGYEPSEIMLLHDNQLNADVMDDVLKLFEDRHYGFVPLAEAEQDPVYKAPDSYITKYGPEWGYRWAAERGVKVNGSLEPEPPKWVQ